jgi:hypothetical protein
MSKIAKRSSTRLNIAIIFFTISILLSFLLSATGNAKSGYWAIARPIPIGVELTQADLQEVALELDSSESKYLSSEINLVGSVTLRPFLRGELIDSRFLTRGDSAEYEKVSISLAASDIPISTQVGDFVSIFQLFDSHNGEPARAPLRVLTEVFLSEIERKGSNFGNTLTVTLLLNQSQVPSLLAASSQGRLVIVGAHG